MGFLVSKVVGDGSNQLVISNDATLEAVINSLVAFNKTSGDLNFSVLLDGELVFTEGVVANSSFRLPDKINLGASSSISVLAPVGIDVTVSYLQQAIDVAGALNNVQALSQFTTEEADRTAAVYSDFDSRYLGPKAVAPNLDNEGNPLTVGSLYYNTSDGYMKVYDGIEWNNAYATSHIDDSGTAVDRTWSSDKVRTEIDKNTAIVVEW